MAGVRDKLAGAVPGDARSTARRTAHGPWVDRLAKVGLAARGTVYLVIGWLAVEVALGRSREADQNGALRAIAGGPFGKVLLGLLALGFAGYAAWMAVQACYGEAGGDDGAGAKLKAAVRTVVYASLCGTTVALITGGNSSRGSARGNTALTARVMQHTGGRLLVGVAGAVLIAIGLALAVEGLKKKPIKRLVLTGVSAGTRSAIEKLGVGGTVARGLVFAVAGFFVIQAAVTYSPAKARGLDAALHALARNSAGPWLLGLVALGLIAFGIFGFVEARYRRTTPAS